MQEVNKYMDLLLYTLYLEYGETHINIRLDKKGYEYKTIEKEKDLFKHIQLMLSFAIKLLNEQKLDKKEIEMIKEYINIMELIIDAKENEK